MNSELIRSRLDALHAAGIEYVSTGGLRYKVGSEQFFYWPSTDRWRSFSDGVGGYGVKSLIKAIREGVPPRTVPSVPVLRGTRRR